MAEAIPLAAARPRVLLAKDQASPSLTAGPISSHADRDRIIETFRNALVRDEDPEAFALQTVQEAIQPQKQTVLVLDENQSLENALRTLLQELVSSAVQSGKSMMHGQALIPRLLDVVLFLCEQGHVEGGMVFQLLEDLIEMSTIKDSKEVFGYIESKQYTLGKQELFGRGKLVMLRTCNQLLRRLSKANDVVFCGRILMFLAHFFPLSERSAVNIKGVFNTSNDTKYEKDASDGVLVDFNFYKTFWSLQEHFSNPVSTASNPSKWQKFVTSLKIVLDAFEAQPLTDDDGKVNLEQEEEATFSIKYLTSSNLMGLELKDPSFRRHVLVQCLILFDYLKLPGKNDKDGPSENMKEDINSCEEHVKRLLEVIPPKGKKFLECIEHILEREKNWVWWKRDGCPAFEKLPAEKKSDQEGTKKRKQRWRLGNKELSQLWKWADQNPDVLTNSKRVSMPSVAEYWKPLADDMDPSAGIEAEYHHKNNQIYCWKGLRFAARQDLEGFSRFTDHGIEGVVPLELLPLDSRPKPHVKQVEKVKRPRREEETKSSTVKSEDHPQVLTHEVAMEGAGNEADVEEGAIPDAMELEISERLSSEGDTKHENGQSEAEAETETGELPENASPNNQNVDLVN